uniref:Uncharacterized protein n=1 Tax=Anguilla anguilla TaxID=7936 RepID=A0A0E9Q8T2_ANGAN
MRFTGLYNLLFPWDKSSLQTSDIFVGLSVCSL